LGTEIVEMNFHFLSSQVARYHETNQESSRCVNNQHSEVQNVKHVSSADVGLVKSLSFQLCQIHLLSLTATTPSSFHTPKAAFHAAAVLASLAPKAAIIVFALKQASFPA
jgi:hypothetical protein